MKELRMPVKSPIQLAGSWTFQPLVS